MAQGWIKLHREMLDNPAVNKDTDYLAVWVYLLLNATHSEIRMDFNGSFITLKPGQLITGRKAISSFYKISESKVQRILKTFENEHQIEQQTSGKGRLITVKNWDKYQTDEQQIEQQVNNKRTTSEQQVNTNKNVKNVKNVKNINTIVEKYSTESTEVWLANYLYKKMLKNDDKARQPNIQKWAENIDKLIRLDKRDPHEIIKVIDYATSDDFWKSNILSTAKLREKYQTLKLRMESNKKQNSNELSEATRKFLQKGD